MSPSFKPSFPSSKDWFSIACILSLLCLAFFAHNLVWPLTWTSAPVLLCLLYAVPRIIFEMTINRANVPTMATGSLARQEIAKILQREAAVSPKEIYKIVDLGSGRGELARTLAKRIPKSKVIGVEMAYFPYHEASLIQRWFGPSNLSYERQDFWSLDCSPFDAAVLYLGPATSTRMGEKLRQEMKPGSVIVTYTYPLSETWTPDEVVTFRSPFKETLYVYKRK